MINAVGREIPEEILKLTGKEVFQGNDHFDGREFRVHGPKTACVINSNGSKLENSIHDVLVKCGIRDGMTISFHHHFRDGDYIVNMVMEEIHRMGIRDITICASSLGKAHDPIVPYIEDGTITNIQSSGVRGKIGEAISNGKLKGLAVMRSHGGRVRAIVTGETQIDIAFIGAPTCDEYGNCRGIGGGCPPCGQGGGDHGLPGSVPEFSGPYQYDTGGLCGAGGCDRRSGEDSHRGGKADHGSEKADDG